MSSVVQAMRRTHRGGQAIVELAVALIAITAVLAALLTFGRLGREHLNALHESRGEAARAAMSDIYTVPLPYPRFLRDWDVGPDRAHHSRDDAPLPGDPLAVRAQLVSKAQPQELGNRVPGNPVTGMMIQEPMIYEYRMVSGRAHPRTVPLMPIVRALFYDAEEVRIEAETWLTWTQRLP